MGNTLPPPPPVVLVPPIFDYPPLAERTSMTAPAYDILFGKMALQCLFQDYFERASDFVARIMLKPIEDPHVDLVATVSGSQDKKIEGDAVFRWQRELDYPHTFMELSVSTSEQMLLLKTCAFHPRHGFGAFGTFPLLMEHRLHVNDYGTIGLRYGSESLSIGTTVSPFSLSGGLPNPMNAWAVGRRGRLSMGLQYKPIDETKFDVSKSLSYAIGYGSGITSPLRPSFNFCLEFAKGSQLVASFYQHVVVQRRVRNPFEQNEVVGITNYIDLGLELRRRFDGDKLNDLDKSSFQIAASWQANKNILLKGKLGSSFSSVVFAFKCWWKPSFTFSISAITDHIKGTTSFGFGIRLEDLREARYERADPNYVMLTQSKEHVAEGVLRNWGKRPMFQSDLDSGNYDRSPRELRPIGKII